MPTDTQNLTEARVRELAQDVLNASKKGKHIPSLEEIKELFLALPPQTDRSFEKTVVDYALKWDDTVINTDVRNLIDLIKKDAPTQEERKLAFIAFCVLENYARRNENLSDLRNAMNDYHKYFVDEPFLIHLDLCSDIKELEAFKKASWTAERLEQMIQKARTNMGNLTGNVGGNHAFAETVLLAFENAPQLLDEIPKLKKQDLLKEALDVMVEVHIMDSAYAKFYSTHGRLLAIDGKFEDALTYLNKAIDKEDNTRADYPIRIGRYLAFIQQVRALQQAHKSQQAAEEQLKAFEEKTQQSTGKSMEFLGLFSGIVSFTIGSLTITGAIAEQSIKNAAGLIIILMGALIGVFAAFGIILHGAWGKKALRNLVVLLLGIGIVLGGVWLCLQ